MSHFAAFAAAVRLDDEVGGPLDSVFGLPAHPLLVHGAVVVLPLAALCAIAIALVPRWRRLGGLPVLAGLFAGVFLSFLAKESGEQLAHRVGEPEAHAELGDVLPLMAFGLLLLTGIWLYLVRRAGESAESTRNIPATVLSIAVIAMALLNIVWVVRVGHSGAEAVWGDTITSPPSE